MKIGITALLVVLASNCCLATPSTFPYENEEEYWDRLGELKIPEGATTKESLMIISMGLDPHVRLNLAASYWKQIDGDKKKIEEIISMMSSKYHPAVRFAAAWTLDKCYTKASPELRKKVNETYKAPEVLLFESQHHYPNTK